MESNPYRSIGPLTGSWGTLCDLPPDDVPYIHSRLLAENIRLTAKQVRRDFMPAGCTVTPAHGCGVKGTDSFVKTGARSVMNFTRTRPGTPECVYSYEIDLYDLAVSLGIVPCFARQQMKQDVPASSELYKESYS